MPRFRIPARSHGLPCRLAASAGIDITTRAKTLPLEQFAIFPVRGEIGFTRDSLTSRAKKVLELAMSEARELNHSYVGTEHLLLGLLREEKGIAAQVLTALGADLSSARAEALRILGAPVDGHSVRVSSSEGQKLRPVGFKLRVEYEGGYRYDGRFERAADVIAFLENLQPPPADGA